MQSYNEDSREKSGGKTKNKNTLFLYSLTAKKQKKKTIMLCALHFCKSHFDFEVLLR